MRSGKPLAARLAHLPAGFLIAAGGLSRVLGDVRRIEAALARSFKRDTAGVTQRVTPHYVSKRNEKSKRTKHRRRYKPRAWRRARVAKLRARK